MLLSTNESWLKLLIAEILHHLIPHFYSVLSKQSHLGLQDLGHQQDVSFPIFQLPGPPSADNTAATVAGPKSSSIESAACSTVAIQRQVWKRPWQHGKGAEKGTRPWTWLGWFELVGFMSFMFHDSVSKCVKSCHKPSRFFNWSHSLDAQRLDKVVWNFKAYPSGGAKDTHQLKIYLRSWLLHLTNKMLCKAT